MELWLWIYGDRKLSMQEFNAIFSCQSMHIRPINLPINNIAIVYCVLTKQSIHLSIVTMHCHFFSYIINISIVIFITHISDDGHSIHREPEKVLLFDCNSPMFG